MTASISLRVSSSVHTVYFAIILQLLWFVKSKFYFTKIKFGLPRKITATYSFLFQKLLDNRLKRHCKAVHSKVVRMAGIKCAKVAVNVTEQR